ncbi:F-box-like, partial [Rhizoctonia solani]
MDWLEFAGNRLEAALDRYIEAILAQQKSYAQEPTEVLVRSSGHSPNLIVFEQKIQQVKASIGLIRNSSTAIVPIHRLPSNLLSRIFIKVTDSETCKLKLDSTDKLPKVPIYLTHVCTQWRKIAIASPDLWTHMDLSPLILKKQPSLSRAQAFLSRSKESPLYLHVEYAAEENEDVSSLNHFISPLVPRIQKLKICINLTWLVSEQRFSRSELSCFLNEDTTAGRLTMLDLSVKGTSRVFCIQAAGQKQDEDSLNLTLPEHRLDKLLLPVTALQLDRIYSPWTSKVYHGLLDLRIHTVYDIRESELVNVFIQSPRLRVLEIKSRINFAHAPPAPIALHSLEVLITHNLSYLELGRFLQVLDTGSSPLFMSIDSPRFDNQLNQNLVDFFSRSNVTGLCTTEGYSFEVLLGLVNLSHTIKKTCNESPTTGN